VDAGRRAGSDLDVQLAGLLAGTDLDGAAVDPALHRPGREGADGGHVDAAAAAAAGGMEVVEHRRCGTGR
jgi:hypothetical protein